MTHGIMPLSIAAKSVLEYNTKMLRFCESGDEHEMLSFMRQQYEAEYPGLSRSR